MSGDARNFNIMETRAVIKFFFLQGKALKKIHTILTETLGENAPSCATVKNGLPSLNMVPVVCLILDNPKQ